jgi:hypothetical protein
MKDADFITIVFETMVFKRDIGSLRNGRIRGELRENMLQNKLLNRKWSILLRI